MDSTRLLMLSQHDLTVFHNVSCNVTEWLAHSVFKGPVELREGVACL